MHTVVPQEFIYDLNQVNLNNHGVNCNQNRLIYFSAELFESLKSGNDLAHSEYMPKFHLSVTTLYPLPIELKETCFIGRLKKFWGKMIQIKTEIEYEKYFFARVIVSFDDAMNHAERLRSHLPAIYNEARIFEQPIPSISTAGEMIHDEQESVDGINNFEEEVSYLNDELTNESNDTTVDVKAPIFDEIQLPTQDALAFDAIFSGEASFAENEMTYDSMNQNDPLENSSAEAAQIDMPFEENRCTESSNEVDREPISQNITGREITITVDDELEYTFTSSADFLPNIENVYQVKQHDILCDNLPFKQNANGDRAFKVQVCDGFKEISLSARAVAGLIKLNTEKRTNKNVDKVFIKVLVIAVCTIKRIKETAMPFNDGEIEFIKGNCLD